jgi:hypothetical protein
MLRQHWMHTPRALVLGIATGLIAAGSAQALWHVSWSAPITALVCFAAVALGGVAWAWYLQRESHDEAAVPVVTSITMMATSLLVAHAAFRVLHGALDGYSHVAAAALGFAVLGQGLGWSLTRSCRRGALGAVLISAVAVVVGLGVMALARGHYEADGKYELVAELGPMRSSEGRFAEERATTMAGFSLGRTCIHHRCLAHVQSGGSVRTIGPGFEQNDKLRLLHSAGQGQLMLEAAGRPLAIADDHVSDWRNPSTFDTDAWLGALPALTAMAGFGLWTSLVVLAFGTRLTRRIRALLHARAGVVQDGWLRLDESSPPRRVATSHEGPVLLASTEPAPAAYRGDALDPALDLIAGDRADVISALERRIHVLDAAALGLCACFTAPIAAAFAAWCLLR